MIHANTWWSLDSQSEIKRSVRWAKNSLDYVSSWPNHEVSFHHLCNSCGSRWPTEDSGCNLWVFGWWVLGKNPSLSEIGRPVEIIHFEHGGTRLGNRRLKFWRLNFWGGVSWVSLDIESLPDLWILCCPKTLRKVLLYHCCIRKIDWLASVCRSSIRLLNQVVWPTFTWWEPGFSSSATGRETSLT